MSNIFSDGQLCGQLAFTQMNLYLKLVLLLILQYLLVSATVKAASQRKSLVQQKSHVRKRLSRQSLSIF